MLVQQRAAAAQSLWDFLQGNRSGFQILLEAGLKGFTAGCVMVSPVSLVLCA